MRPCQVKLQPAAMAVSTKPAPRALRNTQPHEIDRTRADCGKRSTWRFKALSNGTRDSIQKACPCPAALMKWGPCTRVLDTCTAPMKWAWKAAPMVRARRAVAAAGKWVAPVDAAMACADAETVAAAAICANQVVVANQAAAAHRAAVAPAAFAMGCAWAWATMRPATRSASECRSGKS